MAGSGTGESLDTTPPAAWPYLLGGEMAGLGTSPLGLDAVSPATQHDFTQAGRRGGVELAGRVWVIQL